ncbi:hypothetical protein AVEN_93149-1 [Araneus ventricosus]|uniref:Uncharacterized protein n=1 Tax=Araneus ventricosus TaxID=182803 RepID=A0A4Y2MUR9_ARAVE|nr:hypothetical protein AVEN_274506-1 [Araneus ventricosus]GBN28290.1 hypothetical protein AVEN_197401-1 [Araneus ventricosus]GBN29557.1 hypothetical protein AVEN_229488-1 [Araneus ventricosus]GBN29653.1 hypothetical protein AVEN_93149-1 [Araneus ventricosus]
MKRGFLLFTWGVGVKLTRGAQAHGPDIALLTFGDNQQQRRQDSIVSFRSIVVTANIQMSPDATAGQCS